MRCCPSVCVFALATVAWSAIARADEFLIANTTSPDGKYAVYAVDATEEYMPAILEIRSIADQRVRLRLDGVGGHVRFASKYASPDSYGDQDRDSIFVLWNADGSCIAMMVRDGKRSGSVAVYEKKEDSFMMRVLSDFGPIVEQKLKVKGGGRYLYDFPEACTKDGKLLI